MNRGGFVKPENEFSAEIGSPFQTDFLYEQRFSRSILQRAISLCLNTFLQFRNASDQSHHRVDVEQHKGFCHEREKAQILRITPTGDIHHTEKYGQEDDQIHNQTLIFR